MKRAEKKPRSGRIAKASLLNGAKFNKPGIIAVALMGSIIGMYVILRIFAATPGGGVKVSTFDEHLTQVNGTIAGWTLQTGQYAALYDGAVSHLADGSGSINLRYSSLNCPIVGDPLVNTQQNISNSGDCGGGSNYGWGSHSKASANVVSTKRYTLTYWSRTNAAGVQPVGSVETVNGTTTLTTGTVSSTKSNTWERHDIFFVTYADAVDINFYRIYSSDYTASLWVDDIKITEGWNSDTTAAPRKAFNGSVTQVDADANYKTLNNTGQMADYFPWCMTGPESRYPLYASNGWNCVWSTGMATFDPLYWADAGSLSANNSYCIPRWGASSDPNNYLHGCYHDRNFAAASNDFTPAVAARATNSEFAPDGLKVELEFNGAIRGVFGDNNLDGTKCTGTCHIWSPSLVTNAKQVIGSLATLQGGIYNSRIWSYIFDAENEPDKLVRTHAMLKLVRNTDGMQRPIVANVGNPGSQSEYFDQGTPLIDTMGVYNNINKGQFDTIERDSSSHAVAPNYCQLNPEPNQSQAYVLRAWVYEGLAAGCKMFAIWTDNIGGPGKYGGLDVTQTQWWADSKWLVREQKALWPLLKTQVPTSWTPTTDTQWAAVYPRDYNGKHYIFLLNEKDNATTTTVTLNTPVTAGTPAKDWFTGKTIGTFDAQGKMKVDLAPINSSSAARGLSTELDQDTGTMVLLVDDSNTPALTTTPTVTLPPVTATPLVTLTPTPTPVPTIAPNGSTLAAGTYDDNNAALAYSSSPAWEYYPPGTDSTLYLGGNHTSRAAGATTNFKFSGTGVKLYGSKDTMFGKATVNVDGTSTTLDAYANSRAEGGVIFETTGLAAGTHTLTLTVLGSHSSAATDSYVVVDKIDVTTGTVATCTKAGDANCDGKVNNTDLQAVLSNYGKKILSRGSGDLTGDGVVNIFDLSQVLQNWGR